MARDGVETYYNAADKSLYYTNPPNVTTTPKTLVTAIVNGSNGGVAYPTNNSNGLTTVNPNDPITTMRPFDKAMSSEG